MIDEEPSAQEKAAARPIMRTALRKAGWVLVAQWLTAVLGVIWIGGLSSVFLLAAALFSTLGWLSYRKGSTEILGDLKQ